MKWPNLGIFSPVSLFIMLSLLSSVALVIKDSRAQTSLSFDELDTKPKLQCFHTPILPQPNETITITARALNGSLAPKIVNEIMINTSNTEPAIIHNNSNFTSRIGPFANLTTISYGCSAIDNSSSSSVTFTGTKKITVGSSFNGSSAIPVILTGDRNSNISSEVNNNIDILFIADNKSFSSPRDPGFLNDVEKAIQIYYNQSLFLENQNRTNFWIAQDMGQVGVAADGTCTIMRPTNWDFKYQSFDAAVILHRNKQIRDCTLNDSEVSTASVESASGLGHVFLHEISHRPFGLADEYDYYGMYDSSSPGRNVYDNKTDCENETGKECREILYQGNITYFTSDPKLDDMMVNNKQFHDLDGERIGMWFNKCLTPYDDVPSSRPEYCPHQK